MTEFNCEFYKCSECSNILGKRQLSEYENKVVVHHEVADSNEVWQEITNVNCPYCRKQVTFIELRDSTVPESVKRKVQEMKIDMTIEFVEPEAGRDFLGRVDKVERKPGKFDTDQWILSVKNVENEKWKMQPVFIGIPKTATDTRVPARSVLEAYVKLFQGFDVKGASVPELINNLIGLTFRWKDSILKDGSGDIIGKGEKLIPYERVEEE